MNSSGIFTQNFSIDVIDSNFDNTTFSAMLDDLAKFSYYTLWVTASTALGDGNQTSDVIDVYTEQDVPEGPVQSLAYENVSSAAVNISWLPPSQPNGIVFYNLSLTKGDSQVLGLITYDTNKFIDQLEKYTDYILRVTPATEKGFSAKYTASLHIKTEEDVPQSSPIITAYKNLTSTSVLLSWNPPDQPCGVLVGYDVELYGPNMNSSFATTNNSVVLQNLLPFTPYNIFIAASTRKGRGPFVQFLFYTEESEPSAPPQNLTVINYTADAAWLRWSVSPQPNGVVRLYNFKILENDSQIIFYQNLSGLQTEGVLVGFKPFKAYFVSASAFTKVGNGDHFSNTVSFTTKESVPDLVQNLHCVATSWQSVLLQWDAPSRPNGRITHYIIMLQKLKFVVASGENVYTVRELLANSSYQFTIKAATSAGEGKEQTCIATTYPEEGNILSSYLSEVPRPK
ncbi:phosphatidylinositol phosphatase PTPRQ-like isoform X1 [Rhinatrema bivittatum]|uniref:phosphatidylinositol phosphatase PTPRQ-like isoform X1 n=1 Tax=Rhinatrema bivittatum TaxID=194408 RepID=UPI00112A1A05|nr:phosphatidylinositol phosphatase PTPRQ-like isoform X1 [Rhinatrema bivittatum]